MKNQSVKISKKFWTKLIIVPVFMFGFSYLMVPLYDAFCELTGLNGKTGRLATVDQGYEVNNSRIINVNFLSDISAGFPVNFYPEVKKMQVIPGKFYQLNYIARSTSDKIIIGQAIPSVAPPTASLHFNKVVCFCFNNQTFKPHETVKMPINFVIAPDLDKDVVDVTLSYKFFRLKQDT